MYFIVPPKRQFYCTQKDENGKNWMSTGKNYLMLTGTLPIEKQMWFVFCLNFFIIRMFRFLIKPINVNNGINTSSAGRTTASELVV